KSAFPENHPLSLGSGGRSISKQLHHFLTNADLIFGIGCSFAITNYGVSMPKGKKIIHATLDPTDFNKDVAAEQVLAGDAALTLGALLAEVKDRLKGKPRGRLAPVTKEIATLKAEWLAQWMPRLTANTTPLSPYGAPWALMHTADRVRANPDPIRPLQQLLDGDRAQDHEGRHPEVPEHRHQRPLRRLRQGARMLWRADHRAGRDRSGDQAWDRQDPRGRAHAARVHHGEGRGLFYVFLSPGRGMGPRTCPAGTARTIVVTSPVSPGGR